MEKFTKYFHLLIANANNFITQTDTFVVTTVIPRAQNIQII